MTSSGGILSAPTKFPHGMKMFLSLWGEAYASCLTCYYLLENLCNPKENLMVALKSAIYQHTEVNIKKLLS